MSQFISHHKSACRTRRQPDREAVVRFDDEETGKYFIRRYVNGVHQPEVSFMDSSYLAQIEAETYCAGLPSAP